MSKQRKRAAKAEFQSGPGGPADVVVEATYAPKAAKPAKAFHAEPAEITGKASHTIHDDDPRMVKSPNAPKEQPTETITPRIGPNPDGIDHQIALAHAPGDDEREKRARGFERRHQSHSTES